MNDITVKDIIHICNGKLLIGDEDLVINNFSKDTREIRENDTYVGMKGERFDGNMFFEQAFQNGANSCMIQNIEISSEILEKYKDKTIIIVEDTIKAIQDLAKYKRSLYDIPVIAITGSVGKTSTKDIVASIVSKKYKTLKTEGNLNNHIGLPLTILKLKDHEALVVEMGMNHFREISVLTDIAKPNIAIITNIGTSHIGNLGSRENILKAKLEILEGLIKDGILILNNDNDLLSSWNKENKEVKTYTYGIENKSDLNAINIDIEENKSAFEIQVQEQSCKIIVPVSGKHYIYNSLCAIAVGIKLKIQMNQIIQGIKEFELTKKRMEIIKANNEITIINDSYNASYDSVKAALEYIGSLNAKRKIAVLGDMLELGEFSKDLHERLGTEVISNHVKILVTVGEQAQHIAKQAIELGMDNKNIYVTKNNKEAINILKQILKAEDYLLLKASNGMKFEEILKEIV